MKTILKATRLLALVILIPIGLFLAAAGVLSYIPVNSDWREPAADITIYVQSNGVHTGIILPAHTAGVDWGRRVQPQDTPGQTAPQWLEFGWGNRDFYINTPTWARFKWSYALAAATGQGDTLVHVDLLNRVAPDTNTRALRVTPGQYRKLATFIDSTFANEREVIHGYGAGDVFYGARGHYSVFRTCNVWTTEALNAAGIRTATWSPFADGVMRWVPANATSTIAAQ